MISEAIMLVIGFVTIYLTLVGLIWVADSSFSWRLAMTATTTIWAVTSSMAVIDGVVV